MLDEYRDWVNSRRNSITDKVIESLNQLLLINKNVKKVWLSGSYVKGDWIDENTPLKYRDYKYKITGKDKISDIDFITEPEVNPTEYYDIIPLNNYRLLIYDNSKTKI